MRLCVSLVSRSADSLSDLAFPMFPLDQYGGNPAWRHDPMIHAPIRNAYVATTPFTMSLEVDVKRGFNL